MMSASRLTRLQNAPVAPLPEGARRQVAIRGGVPPRRGHVRAGTETQIVVLQAEPPRDPVASPHFQPSDAALAAVERRAKAGGRGSAGADADANAVGPDGTKRKRARSAATDAVGKPTFHKDIVTYCEDRYKFQDLQASNPGLLIVKFGAAWCKPCHQIQVPLDAFFATSPDDTLCMDIDIDINRDLYSYFAAKKQVLGIPAILVFRKGNNSFIPDDSVSGSNLAALDAFFRRVGNLRVMPKITRGY